MSDSDDTLQAVNLLLLLVRMAMESLETAEDISQIIANAQEEGRDLNAEELEDIKSKGDAVIANWQSPNAE